MKQGVGVLVIRDGKVLLGRRRGSHGSGAWALPGGRPEEDESIEACARRELLEETGLELGVAEIGPSTTDVFPDNPETYFTTFVLARASTGSPQNKEPHKCDGWFWFRWPELPTPLFTPLDSLRKSGFVPK